MLSGSYYFSHTNLNLHIMKRNGNCHNACLEPPITLPISPPSILLLHLLCFFHPRNIHTSPCQSLIPWGQLARHFRAQTTAELCIRGKERDRLSPSNSTFNEKYLALILTTASYFCIKQLICCHYQVFVELNVQELSKCTCF